MINHKTIKRVKDFKNSQPCQIMDLKQLADLAESHKAQYRAAMQKYKAWQRQHITQTDNVALLYGSMEETMLRRYAVDSLKLYRIIKRDYVTAFDHYFTKKH